MDPKSSENTNVTPSIPQEPVIIEKKDKKFFIVIAILLLVVIFCWGLYFLSGVKKSSNQMGMKKTQLNTKILSGNILFVENKTLKLLNPKTDATSVIIPLLGFSPTWEYTNNYVFIATDSAVTRLSLVTRQSQSFAFHPLGAPLMSPSPDGQKIEIINAPGYPGDRTPPDDFIYDFSTQKRTDLPTGSNFVAWFTDNQHILIDEASTLPAPSLPDGSYSGSIKLLLYDLQNNTTTPIAEGPIRSVTVSQTGFHVLWFQYAVIPNPTNPLGDSAVPSMYTTTIDPLKDTVLPVSITPESKFPVVARDFQGISSVLPGKKDSFFFVNMSDKKGSVYFTDSYPWGTFKKISPDGPYVYRMISYNLDLDKVLAYKISDQILQKFPKNTGLSEQLVFIDEGSSSEKVLTKLSSSNVVIPPVFSPDNQFILTPTTINRLSEGDYTIFSVQNPKLSLTLKEDLGNKFYWIK